MHKKSSASMRQTQSYEYGQTKVRHIYVCAVTVGIPFVLDLTLIGTLRQTHSEALVGTIYMPLDKPLEAVPSETRVSEAVMNSSTFGMMPCRWGLVCSLWAPTAMFV